MTFEIAKYFGDFQNAGTHDSEWEVLRSRDLIFENLRGRGWVNGSTNDYQM